MDEIRKAIDAEEPMWNCRFHPTDWWHEVGCPHVEWTKDQLQRAIVDNKKFEAWSLRQQNNGCAWIVLSPSPDI